VDGVVLGLVSITYNASGRDSMSRMPPRFFSILMRSRSRWTRSFLVIWVSVLASWRSTSLNRSTDRRRVTKLVRVPPSHRFATKNMPHRLASSFTTSCA
jgi:hypothetical protein